ncbi:hypothetical protein [Nocardioides sp. zg-1230]|uniref:hypothetical protein n=1 Tax=Nocardioides sp. zg-1230 TaxID=2736601 RepID=UPI0015556D82|nr:hypothetical protein [Nocardioides sp. zg-1230]NPC44473.1 hypothetical protein [Nocardioides sp. zg-1230]
MPRMMIRVDAELSPDALSAFPHLVAVPQRPQTVLSGDVADQEELQGVISLLVSLGVEVVDVLTVPAPTGLPSG